MRSEYDMGYAVKIGRDGEVECLDSQSDRMVLMASEVHRVIEIARRLLEEMNTELVRMHGRGVTLRVPGVATARISAPSSTVRVRDPKRLRKALGDHWDALVEADGYTARPQLVQLSVDGDEPLAPEIRQCLTIVDTAAVTWRSDY